MHVFFRKFFQILVYLFAIVGVTFTIVFFGMRFGIFNVRGSIASRNAFFTDNTSKPTSVAPCTDTLTVCEWNGTPEWQAIKGGLEKDTAVIQRVSSETGISSRMIASVVVPEQTRFFSDNREIFKSYFEPLKLLGAMTQFSLGISGIKQETAVNIERYANDPTSELYPGDNMASLIAYAPGVNESDELYLRLTDPKDHYYQYLYTAIFIKEIQAQWQKSGYTIQEQPEVLVTLFNLGFQASHPKANPQVAGSLIKSGGKTYAYGELGSLFYHSGELSTVFP